MKFILILTVLVGAPACAQQPDSYHEKIARAVICETSPLWAIRELKAEAAILKANNIVYTDNNESGMLEAVAISLKEPIGFYGSTAHIVRMEMVNRYENLGFGGYVYGEFEGEFREVVREMKLKKITNHAGGTSYVQDIDQSQCPSTIELLPLEGQRFLLGCGWCNG